ncbi:MAG TPA: rRNA maturation RNase YbeY [Terriglobales bacterium]|nr:rRNA maturation RNase YbeY [Terriglobales bacterium]
MRKPIEGVTRAELERFAARARRAAGVRGPVDILLTTNDDLRRLNKRFRGKDKPTDVLSFRAPGPGLPDDLAISSAIAQANARRLGHSAGEELKVLILHGLLHLAGYDHERDQGEMRREEDRLRRRLGLPVTLIARAERPRKRSRR